MLKPQTIILYQGGDGKFINQKYIVATVYGWEASMKNGKRGKVFPKYVARASNLTMDEALDLAGKENELEKLPTINVMEIIK